MPFKLRWCPVLKTHITYVTDLEDRAIRVICYEYEEATGACRVKRLAHDEPRTDPPGMLMGAGNHAAIPVTSKIR